MSVGQFEVRPLDGGARLVTAPMSDRASVSLVLMFAVGSRYEDDRLGGVSHFIEHLFFKGTRKRPTSKEIAEAIEGVGGVINASTDKEVTTYWTRVPAEHLELAVDVLFDIVSDSKLNADDIDRERMVILEELKMYQDLPQDFVHNLFEEVMWPGHPLGRDIGGTLASVSALSRDDLVDFITHHYSRPHLVVSLSGGINPDRAAEMVSDRVGGLALKNGSGYLPAPAGLDKPGLAFLNKKTEQAHLCLGTRAISYLDDDRYALDLVNTILGEGMSSRLFLEIREKRGLAYDVHSFTSKHHDGGYFAVYAGVDPSKAEETVKAILAELRKMVEQPVPETELTKAREYTKGRLKLGLESTNAMASWLGQQQLLAGRIRPMAEVVASIDAVDQATIQRVASRILDQPIQLSVIGPFASDAGFRAAIGL
ncbi:MAG TPA: pitrilysin family protein [Candidatus Dormibacteraeota bacterium]|nr:pitrilysin family protein [Candidatus Dormibacteraeota bacterium]